LMTPVLIWKRVKNLRIIILNNTDYVDKSGHFTIWNLTVHWYLKKFLL
jgi:hypothetical protein